MSLERSVRDQKLITLFERFAKANSDDQLQEYAQAISRREANNAAILPIKRIGSLVSIVNSNDAVKAAISASHYTQVVEGFRIYGKLPAPKSVALGLASYGLADVLGDVGADDLINVGELSDMQMMAHLGIAAPALLEKPDNGDTPEEKTFANNAFFMHRVFVDQAMEGDLSLLKQFWQLKIDQLRNGPPSFSTRGLDTYGALGFERMLQAGLGWLIGKAAHKVWNNSRIYDTDRAEQVLDMIPDKLNTPYPDPNDWAHQFLGK